MDTLLFKVDPASPDEAEIAQAAEIIRNGGLVAFPTETVYGLGGDAMRPESSKKIYAAKGRPSDNPLIVHIAALPDLFQIASYVPKEALSLAEAYWPGPLTMIFQKKETVPYETTGGLDTVAVRFPSHPVAKKLISASGTYIAAPSANTSGRPSPTRAEHVITDLSGKIDCIIDGGSSEIGLESTIVDFTEERPMILRPGYIGIERLRKILPDVQKDPGFDLEKKDVRPKAPGMRYRHYAPYAEMTLYQGNRMDRAKAICAAAKEALEAGKKVGILSCTENEPVFRDTLSEAAGTGALSIKAAGSENDGEMVAGNLYDMLRGFDQEKVDVIFAETFEMPEVGDAIMNRLRKAAGGRVFCV